jgi:hypothetical protein
MPQLPCPTRRCRASLSKQQYQGSREPLGKLGLALPLAIGLGTRGMAFEALPASKTSQGVPRVYS